MNWLNIALFLVWIVVMAFVAMKLLRARTMAGTHVGDHSAAVREAYERQMNVTANAGIICAALAAISFIVAWIGKGRNSDALFVGGGTGVVIFLGLLFASIGYRQQCPVCGAQLQSGLPLQSGVRFCSSCGAQLEP